MRINFEKKKNALWMDGYTVVPLANPDFVQQVRALIESDISIPLDELNGLERNKFHEVISNAQQHLNDKGLNKRFFLQNSENIQKICGEARLSYVNVMKLRAVRPTKKIDQRAPDHVGFHRESLYADGNGIKHQFNLWVPISSAAQTSGILAVKNSHTLLDAALHVEQNVDDPAKVERFSYGHKIGIPYAPKNIDKTPEVQNGEIIKIEVPIGCFVMFSTMLIHGRGENFTDHIRFSVDTGVIPTERIDANKPKFAANQKPHYTSM